MSDNLFVLPGNSSEEKVTPYAVITLNDELIDPAGLPLLDQEGYKYRLGQVLLSILASDVGEANSEVIKCVCGLYARIHKVFRLSEETLDFTLSLSELEFTILDKLTFRVFGTKPLFLFALSNAIKVSEKTSS